MKEGNSVKKIIIPEKLTDTILAVSKRDGLLECYDFGDDLKETVAEELNGFRYNRKYEQLLYQLLLLYDEVILTDPKCGMFDLSRLENVVYYDYNDQERIVNRPRLDHIVPVIEFDFSQYIKPAVIHYLKREMAPMYKIKYPGFSEYQFASKLYDMVYMTGEQKRILVEKYKHIYDANAKHYSVLGLSKNRKMIPNEYFRILLAYIASVMDPVLRDFELCRYEKVDILDPPYSSEKLGIYSRKINNFEDVYGTLRVECNRMIPALPHFNSISEVQSYREKNMRQIRNLRNEIDNLENILITEGKEKMIIEASKDVEKAAKELSGLDNTPVDTWTTFISLPATLLETYFHLPPIVSLPIAVYGISSYCKKKYIEDKHGWIRVVR